MSLSKRGKYWWYEFWFAGRRIQESSKSASKSIAKLAEQKRRGNWRRASTVSRTSAKNRSEQFGSEPRPILKVTFSGNLARKHGRTGNANLGGGTITKTQALFARKRIFNAR